MMQGIHWKIGFNTLIQTSGKVISIISSFILVGFLTRYLGAFRYGDYTTIFTYVGFFAIIGEFGLDQFLIKELGKFESESKHTARTINNVAGLRLLLITFSLILAVLVSLILPYSSVIRLGILITSFTSYFFYFFSIMMSYFQVKLNFFYPVLADTLGKIFVSAVSIILILAFKTNLLLLVTIPVLGAVLSFLILLLFFKREKMCFSFGFDCVFWRKIFLFALPIALVSFLNQIFFRIDVPLLSLISGSEAVGIYGLAFRVYDYSAIPAALFTSSVFPILARSVKELKLFKDTLKQGIIFLFLAGLILAFFIFWFSPLIVKILGGVDFGASVLPLKILAVSLTFLYISDLLRVAIISIEKQGYLSLIYGISAALNVFLNLILIPRFSYLAAAWVCITTRIVLVLGMTLVILTSLRSKKANEG